MSEFLRRQGGATQTATRVCNTQEEIWTISGSLLSEGRARVEETIRASQREEHQTVASSCEEMCGSVAHCSANRSHWVAAKRNANIFGRLHIANENNAELEHRLQSYAQHTLLMQHSAAQHIS